MKIQTTSPLLPLDRPALKKAEGDGQQPPPDRVDLEAARQPATHTSWFHRATGAVAGGAAFAVAGVALIGPQGNGMGAEGLIYPLVGLLGGAGCGVVAGALAAGRFHSTEQTTSRFHAATAVVSGALAGGVLGTVLLASAGNGKGAEGLLYPLMGMGVGVPLGGLSLGLMSSHFPDTMQ